MRLTVRARTWVAGLALVAVLGTWMLARPAGAQSEIDVIWPNLYGKSAFTDVGHDGLRLGDRLTSRGPIWDATGTSEIGKGHQACLVQRRITDGPEGPGGLYRCSYLLRLADGDIIIEGLDPHGPGVYTMAVLGGTGAYAGATGDATLTDSDAGTEFAISLIT